MFCVCVHFCFSVLFCFLKTKNLDLDNHREIAKMNEDVTISEKV